MFRSMEMALVGWGDVNVVMYIVGGFCKFQDHLCRILLVCTYKPWCLRSFIQINVILNIEFYFNFIFEKKTTNFFLSLPEEKDGEQPFSEKYSDGFSFNFTFNVSDQTYLSRLIYYPASTMCFSIIHVEFNTGAILRSLIF